MEGDAVFREYVGDEGVCNVNGSSVVSSRNEYSFFRKAIYDHEDGRKSTGAGELLDEVHTD